jgi:MFS transporter, ACS family, hexuronate transporter
MKRTSQVERISYDGAAGHERRSLGDLMNSPIVSQSRWVMLAFAFVATVINYLDRQTLSVMAPVLLERFKISATIYSHIIFAFMLAYTVMNGVSGPLLDRLGTKLGYALTIAWWSAAEILHAFSVGAISLAVFRFLLGVGEAGNYPAGVKVIGEWFPPQERSLASGIFTIAARRWEPCWRLPCWRGRFWRWDGRRRS